VLITRYLNSPRDRSGSSSGELVGVFAQRRCGEGARVADPAGTLTRFREVLAPGSMLAIAQKL
jgi:hypothetical protein